MPGWSHPARRHRLPASFSPAGSFPYVNRLPVTRRAALAAVAGVGAVVLSGCDIRLEKGAPQVPGLQTQGPPADTPALQHTVAGRQALLTTLIDPAAGWPTQLKPVYQQQLTRLQAVMASTGMPQATATPSNSGVSVVPFPAYLRGQIDASTFARIAGVDTAYTPMLAAISAVDAAATTVIDGAAASWPGGALPPAIAAQLVSAVRGAVYGLEVVAARTPLEERALPAATLAQLYPVRSRLEATAASSAPRVQSSHRLVADPATAAGRTAIARDVLDSVVAACAGQAAAAHGSSADVAQLLQLWGTHLGLGWRWGVAPVPFPGLTG